MNDVQDKFLNEPDTDQTFKHASFGNTPSGITPIGTTPIGSTPS